MFTLDDLDEAVFAELRELMSCGDGHSIEASFVVNSLVMAFAGGIRKRLKKKMNKKEKEGVQ